MVSSQFIPLGSQHIRFHDALLGGHEGRRISEEVRHGTNPLFNFGDMQLGRLVADALGEITRLGYSRRSRNRYRAIWEHLIDFSRRMELEMSSLGISAARFIPKIRREKARLMFTVV